MEIWKLVTAHKDGIGINSFGRDEPNNKSVNMLHVEGLPFSQQQLVLRKQSPLVVVVRAGGWANTETGVYNPLGLQLGD